MIDNVKINYTNKLDNQIYPFLNYVGTSIDINLVEKNLNYPMIVKTLSGSYGSGVFMVDDKKNNLDK